MVRSKRSLLATGALAVISTLPGCPVGATESCEGDVAACNVNQDWSTQAQIFEYESVANPAMTEVPVRFFGPEMHQQGPTQVIPFDLSEDLQLKHAATSPNLLASFVRIVAGDGLATGVERATSQMFYAIRGHGSSKTRAGQVDWKEGDLFVVPYLGHNATAVCDEASQCVLHSCFEDPHYGRCALYWVHDEPLLKYLGVRPDGERRFEPALYPGDVMRGSVASIPTLDDAGRARNRRGILLGNPATSQTKTLTPTLWSLLNSINANTTQAPHKHNSVALDLAVSAGKAGTVHTKLGRALNSSGHIVDPVVAEWKSGGVFVTPPGWWHSHHNEGSTIAWVLPVQDAGLYTHQRTLDIRFVEGEVSRLNHGESRGATLPDQASASGGSPPPLQLGTIMTGHLR